jgi:methionyl-tRNA formyltransferase
MGTPDFSVPALTALIEAGHDVVAVYSQPPRPAGRGHKERPSAVHAAALTRGIDVRTPVSLKNAEVQAAFAALDLDIAVVVAYGLILPKAILEAPRLGCLNIHASLLPRWRGAAPIQRAILAGDSETGVTIMQMDEGLDTGAMLRKGRTYVMPFHNAGALHDMLSEMGATLIVETIEGIIAGSLKPEPQPSDGVTYATKISREETKIDWSRSAEEINRQVRAFSPMPGAWFEHGTERIKLLNAQPTDLILDSRPAGTVIDSYPRVICGEGALQLGKMQRAGKGPLEASDFLRGYALPPGTKLG